MPTEPGKPDRVDPDDFAVLVRQRDIAEEQVRAVRMLHSKREFNGDGYICVEDRQHWPCATVKVLSDDG